MASIYANCSESYWNERRRSKKTENSHQLKKLSVALILIGVLVVCILCSNRKKSSPTLTSRNTGQRLANQASIINWKQCESRINSHQECIRICQPERTSIHRKVMHLACLEGCQLAQAESIALGCRGKLKGEREDSSDDSETRLKMASKENPISEEDAFRKIGVLGYNHCAKFQNVDPRPDVFATCRKYHRAGTKQGFQRGALTMKELLEEGG